MTYCHKKEKSLGVEDQILKKGHLDNVLYCQDVLVWLEGVPNLKDVLVGMRYVPYL